MGTQSVDYSNTRTDVSIQDDSATHSRVKKFWQLSLKHDKNMMINVLRDRSSNDYLHNNL